MSTAQIGSAGDLGKPLARIEAIDKLTGSARYAYEYPQPNVAYAWAVNSGIACGTILSTDLSEALAAPGVIAVLTHESAPRLCEVEDGELMVLQSSRVAYRGQVVALAIAETLEAAREASALVRVEYSPGPHDVMLREGHPRLYTPEVVNPSEPADSSRGSFEEAFAGSGVKVDATYRTPAVHNNPMEPHATTAVWSGDAVTLYDSTQGAPMDRDTLAEALGLEQGQVRVVAPHVGGGFGSKGTTRPQAVLAAIAAKHVGRPVKLALTRQQMFSMTGYRTPTIQRVRLGAGSDGRIAAISHDVQEQTSTLHEFAEQTATVTRMMYAAPSCRTTHKLAALDVPTPSWMRAPGECPGMFALESAMDELAVAAALDPIELRIINEPSVDQQEGIPFSSRNLIACLREGAERFGWAGRDATPAARRTGRRLLGTGVASSTYPARRAPSSARARTEGDGRFSVSIGAADIGTGARTVLTQIAADALRTTVDAVDLRIGDSRLPRAMLAGGSMGTASWGSAVVGACRALREQLAAHGQDGDVAGLEAAYDTTREIESQARLSRHAFGAQFAEVSVDIDSGEVHVERLLGVFAAGRILNSRTARSQFLGGMTMGLGMALMEESTMDVRFGDYLNHDLAQYHLPVSADMRGIDAMWIDEDDEHLNPMGAKGIGEIGIVGTAAAIANAVFHATGTRLRELPLSPARVLRALEG